MSEHKFNFEAINEAFSVAKIAILDSMPGSGKTTAITEYLKAEDQEYNRCVLFITPFKSEAQDELPHNKLAGCGYTYPTDGKGGKVKQLEEMLRGSVVPEFGGTLDGSRFTATHYCYSSMDSDAYECLSGFTLVIDETLDVAGVFEGVGHYSVKLLEGHGSFDPKTGQFLFNQQSWFIDALRDDKQQNNWNRDINYHFLKQVSKGMLYLQQNGEQLYPFRVLPKEVLSKAARVVVMTHNFKYSAMECWMRHHGLEYTYVDNMKLGLRSDEDIKNSLNQNIKLIPLTRPLRNILRSTDDSPRPRFSLSQSGWEKLSKSSDFESFGKSLVHMVKDKLTKDQDELFWTVPKVYKGFITKLNSVFRGKPGEDVEAEDGYDFDDEGYSYGSASGDSAKKKQFVESYLPSNIKAINGYGHVGNCVYGVNLHLQLNYKNLLTRMYKQISLVEDLLTNDKPKQNEQDPVSTLVDDTYALNSLLQFIHRGTLRNNQEMNLLVLSDRIEKLLKQFLTSEHTFHIHT